MLKKSKWWFGMNFIKIFLIIFMATPSFTFPMAARHALVSLGGTLGITALGMGSTALYQKRVAQEKQQQYFELKNSFREDDWIKIFRWYPTAAKEIKDVFYKRGVEPRLIFFKLDDHFYLYNGYQMGLNKTTLEYVERCNLQKSFSDEDYLNFCQNTGLLRGVVGHELQHAFDFVDQKQEKDEIHYRYIGFVGLIYSFIWKSRFDKLINQRDQKILPISRRYEKRADLKASDNPYDYKMLAFWLEKSYEFDQEQIVQEIDERLYQLSLSSDDVEYEKIVYKKEQSFYDEDDHPHPLVRAHYLKKRANELEAQVQLKRKQQEGEQDQLLQKLILDQQ